MGRLDNKVAVITGAAQGLAVAIVRRFVEEGAKVVGTDMNEDKLKKSLAEFGDSVLAVEQDISSEDDWKRVMAAAVGKFGKVDIVVNCAAIMCMKSILDCSVDEYMKVMKVNSLGTFLGMKYGIIEMKKIGGGSIINIDSIGGLTSGDADGGDCTYSASKGSVRSLTKNAAIAYCADNIRCNTIHPGGIMTELLKEVYEKTPALWDRVKVTSPLPPHICEPRDVANGVLYLASDESRTVTGAELVIDCGYMAH
jgi:NAD(P)-dependent dehydrogenase (short-subunit alcohol dehydrogenase family)